MSKSNDGSKRRASARIDWPVRKYRLGEEPSDDLRDTTTAEERLQMMWQLAVDAWASSGKRLPDYDRGAAPVRKFLRRVS
jgi:hypothetical protein